ncbi:uncharacterized protein LOC110458632 [Mizuhopecten yessoensis]|uniref:uncharacterized protein LOC110458632 n=1 Tax=Mizuhopecten yessoensis TaxID=6573 RepID=UPI000B45A6E9|nr:uncharacterized protein LOC110458632 [Mizuhopecten yessoensis]
MTEAGSSSSLANIYYSEEEFQKAIAAFQIETTSKFVRQKKRSNGGIDIKSLDNKKIWWEDKGGLVEINYTGEPYIVTGSEVYECHHGPLHGKKIRTTKGKDDDHNYESTKSRKLIQDSKKLNCPAKIRVRRIMRFPAFKNNAPKSNSSARKRLSRTLKAAFWNEGLDKQMQIIATFPSDHDNHLQGELSGYSLPLNKEMGMFIKTMAREGVKSVAEMERHLDRFSNDEQINLKASTEKWQKEDPDGNFFLRIASQEEDENPMPFLFVHQTAWQRNILRKFGREMSILDSTYNTSKFELPLYLLCVQTNVGFAVVASMLLGRDTKANLIEVLNIIRNWNHTWQPQSFMCDCDTREISALESVFNGCDVYLCDFHREQAWQRWVNDGKNNLLDKKLEVLQLFRSLANAESEDSYESALQDLRESAIYQEQPHLSNYIEKKWITQSKRWVKVFRSSGQCKVNTTNGFERQHRELKENFLNIDNPGKSLTDMIFSLVNNYLPQCKERFIERNVQCLEGHRSYHTDVPNFLVGRPKAFVSHCMTRLSLASTDDVTYQQVEEGNFSVRSRESDRSYSVTLIGKMPSCNCPDFHKHQWPCKHMLAILGRSDYSWDLLDESFTKTIFNTVDVDFVNNIDSACAEVQASHSIECNDVGEEELTKEDSKIRNECFDLMKQIQSDLYNISSPIGLNSILKHLHEAYCLSQKHIVNIKGLPLRRGKKNKTKK